MNIKYQEIRAVVLDIGETIASCKTPYLERSLTTRYIFAHPYHSWERGLNDNRNGSLRQYFPKHIELIDITEKQVQMNVELPNHRPRNVLGFRTPHEAFFGV